MFCSFYSVFILGAEPNLNNLSKFRGPPHPIGFLYSWLVIGYGYFYVMISE